MATERLCGNPLCGRPFTPARVDGFYCGSTCRGEATRLRDLLQGSNPAAKAVVSALHKREKPKRGPGKRADTHYAVMAQSGNGLILMLVGIATAHERGEAVASVAPRVVEDGDPERFVALPLRVLRPYDADGEPLGGPPPPPTS